jgi:hypothetical protein
VLTSNGRETRILPALDQALLDEVLELSLGQESVHKVESTARRVVSSSRYTREKTTHSPEIENLNLLHTQLFQEPLVLGFPIGILVGPQGVSHAIERIDNGAGQVIHRVRLVLFSCNMMGLVDAPVDGRVTHRTVRGRIVDLGTKEPFLSLF